MPITRAMIAGGKTGGHLYPGVAVAEEILARNPDATITFVGTEDGIESRVLPKLGYPLVTINASRLKGGGLVARLLGLARVPVAMVQSWRALREARPEVVLGVGGYASGPAVLTAWLCRIPTAIQEQNAHPGLTNRILGKLVRAIYLGFDAAGRHFASPRAHATGNPIRHALVASLEAARDRGAPADTDATPTDTLRVLVFGGSQGARFLNENVPAALAQLAAARPTVELTVTHQTVLHDEEATRER